MPEYATVSFVSAPETPVCLSLENLALGRPMSEMMAVSGMWSLIFGIWAEVDDLSLLLIFS